MESYAALEGGQGRGRAID